MDTQDVLWALFVSVWGAFCLATLIMFILDPIEYIKTGKWPDRDIDF